MSKEIHKVDFIDLIDQRKLTPSEIVDMLLDALNFGMTVRQRQLQGYGHDKSAKEQYYNKLTEYINTTKTDYDKIKSLVVGDKFTATFMNNNKVTITVEEDNIEYLKHWADQLTDVKFI